MMPGMRPATVSPVLFVLAACSSAPPPTAKPEPTPAIDAAPADAGVAAAVAAAPAWVFKYSTADRRETWTLRYADGAALLVVETAQGATRYQGTAVEGESLALDVSTATAKMTLDCKHARRPLGTACNDNKATPIEVLDCYHPDFAAPMPFGPTPGVEYVVDATCNGYRLV